MPDEKAPSSGALLPESLMYFRSGQPMHYCSGVDSDSRFDSSEIQRLYEADDYPLRKAE